MQIGRIDKKKLSRVYFGSDLIETQRTLNYMKFREITFKSKATQKQINKLTTESKDSWSTKSKSRFVK